MAEINQNLFTPETSSFQHPPQTNPPQINPPQTAPPQINPPQTGLPQTGLPQTLEVAQAENRMAIQRLQEERIQIGYIISALFLILIIVSGVSIYLVVQTSRSSYTTQQEILLAAKKMDAVVRIYREAKDETHLYTSAIKMMGQIQTAMISEQQSKMITNNALQDDHLDL